MIFFSAISKHGYKTIIKVDRRSPTPAVQQDHVPNNLNLGAINLPLQEVVCLYNVQLLLFIQNLWNYKMFLTLGIQLYTLPTHIPNQ